MNESTNEGTGTMAETEVAPSVDDEGRAGTAVVERVETVPAVADGAAAALDMIIRAATDPAIDVDKMERLMAMHERLTARQAEARFNDAMADAQSEMRPVAADAENTQTKSKYATYAAVDQMLRPIYAKHGFSLSFDSGDGAPENHVRVLCYVGHRDGFTRTYRVDMPADGKGAKGGDVMTKTHATGSAFTYAQRYLLKLVFNVAIGEFDDDGNAAGVEKISAGQKEKLIALMKESDADTSKFLNHFSIDYIDLLPATKFDTAVNMLETKKRQKAENTEAEAEG